MIYENGYKTQKGCHCLLTCIINYLNYKNVEINETSLFLKVKGYNIEKCDDGKIRYSITLLDHINEIGVPYEFFKESSRETAWKKLRELITDEKQVILFLNASRLKYNSAFKYANDIGHCLNAIGYDDQERVYVSDGYIAGFKGAVFEDWLEAEPLLDAWEDVGFSYVLLNLDGIEKKDFLVTEQMIIDLAVEQQKNNLAVEEDLLSAIDSLKKYSDKKELEIKVLEINNHIRVDGLIFTRSYIAKAIEDYVQDKQLSVEYSNLCKEWNIISCILIKLVFDNSAERIDEIRDKIRAVFAKENEIMNSIANKSK